MATGLEYLHKHNIVHGDLKGVSSRFTVRSITTLNAAAGLNILIDSQYCARLADFGVAAIVNESTRGTTTVVGKSQGAIRWMAPELLHPDNFEFIGKFEKQLPSKDMDIYAIGMAVLEASTHPCSLETPISHSDKFFVVEQGVRSRAARLVLWNGLGMYLLYVVLGSSCFAICV